MHGVSYKWHFISEEDRDFYQGCKYAVEKGLQWETEEARDKDSKTIARQQKR